MSNITFTNFAATTLASGINNIVTSLAVAPGTGTLFPTLAGAQYFYAVLADAATGTTREVIKVTARSTDTFTIVRAQDNTTGQTYITGDKIELRLTAAGIATLATTETAQTLAGVQTFSSQPIVSTLTASSALASDASKGLVSVTNTGSGNNVLATSPTISGATLTTSIFNGTIGATTPSTGAFTTLSATGLITASNNAAAQAIFKGWNSADGATNLAGQIQLGQTASSCAVLQYSDAGNTFVYLDSVYNSNGSYIKFRTKTSATPFDAMTIKGDGTVTTGNGLSVANTVAVGGSTLSGSGSGVQFPATQSASTDVNTLDDYEEGTWTPSLGGTATYTSRTGSYTKIGRLVTLDWFMNVNVIGTGSTYAISGIPFNSAGGSLGMGGAITYYYFLTSNVATFAVQMGASAIDVYSSATAATNTTNNSIFGANTYIAGTVTYRI